MSASVPFESYAAGDRTSKDWKDKPATEEAVLAYGALPGGNDTDVLKINHHGSDTSTGSQLAGKLLSEAAIISTEFGEHGFPKRIVLKQIEDNGSYCRSPAMARMT